MARSSRSGGGKFKWSTSRAAWPDRLIGQSVYCIHGRSVHDKPSKFQCRQQPGVMTAGSGAYYLLNESRLVFVTYAVGSRVGSMFRNVSVRFYFCTFIRFFHTISQKVIWLRSPNLTVMVRHESWKKPFILGWKGQRSRSRGTKNCQRGSWRFRECWFLLA